jgi:type IV pilus assembly protein PilQ
MRGVNIMLKQVMAYRPIRFWQSAFCSLVAILMFAGVAWGADTNKLLKMSVDPAASMPTVLIQTVEPVGYRYTVYDSFDPTRVVVDFPGMDSADIPETLAVNLGSVKEVRTSSFDLSSGQLTRVEILLAENTEYQVNLDEKNFRVAFDTEASTAKTGAPVAKVAAKKPAAVKEKVDPTQAASVLKNISVTPGQAILESNGKIGKFQYFALSDPARLVVDVYGLKPAFKKRTFSADAGFGKIRVGTYNDKTRLVFDATGKALPEHLVEGRTSDILVSWGGKTPAKVSSVNSQPKAKIKPKSKPVAAAVAKTGPVSVETIDFVNENGRSVIAVELSAAAKISEPVAEGNLVRFEIKNADISRALRRTIDASAFPSAVTSVTPYTVTENKQQNVRIAVNLKGSVAYTLEKDGNLVNLVIDDGAYAEPVPPAVSQVKVVAPEPKDMTEDSVETSKSASFVVPMTAEEMAAEANRYTGEKITLIFDSANVRSILQLIGDVSGLNILASGDVGGNVTLRLIDVPWDQALELVLDTANLGKIQDGNVMRIMPKGKIREIEQTAMKEQIVAIEEGVLETKVFPISYASVDDMKGFLTDIKSDRGSIIADSRNKQLIVRDVVAVLDQMQEMIDQIDKPERQVMIEARIVEANTNFSRNLGVKWTFDYDQSNDTATKSLAVDSAAVGLGGSFAISPTAGAAGFGSAIAIGALEDQLNIDLRLAALENSGEGKIVSTPRITTLNGESATISQGTKIPFSQIGADGVPNVKFENAELKLTVTPEINPDGSILLDIDASNSAVGTVVPTATGDAVSIDEKKAQTKVLVRDGQTTVIGGIFIEDERDAVTGVPLLKDIPVFGHLFKSSSKTRDRRELLIFITPRIVQP